MMSCLGCCNFLVNITVRLTLGLCMQNNIIQNNSYQKPNYNIVSCFLKNASLRGIEARGDTKWQNFNNFFEER